MKEEIFALVNKRNYVTYADLIKAIPGFKGDYTMFHPNCENLVFWIGISEQAGNAINELRKENKIEMRNCNPLIYLIDGHFLNIPLAKCERSYKQERWLPTTFCIPGSPL